MPGGVLRMLTWRFGVFGKLPQKRDFIALEHARARCSSHSRPGCNRRWRRAAASSAAAWQELYLVSPIWRFWIGGDIFGVACAGALMPSVDSVGRFFPLAILYCAEPMQRASCAPPFDPLDAWYVAIEERLLSVLQDNAEIEVDRLTEGLPVPESAAEPPAPLPARSRRGRVWQIRRRIGSELLSALMAAGLLGLGAGAAASGGRMAAAAAGRSSMSATRCLIHFSM